MAGQYNPYSAGKKTYGGGRPMPTIGPVDPIGYKERDAANAQQNINDRNATLRRLKNNQKGNYFPTNAQKGV
jgi:hypothetical protein